MSRYSHPKYTDGKSIEKIYSKYKAEREKQGLPLENAGVLVALGISPDAWEDYKNYDIDNTEITDKERIAYTERKQTIKKIESECSQSLADYGLRNPKTAGLTVFLLKQKRNGGYTDKQEVITTGDVKIAVKLTDGNGKTVD